MHFSGFVQAPDLPPWYAIADAFVFPTLGDPNGLVVEEALLPDCRSSPPPTPATSARGSGRGRPGSWSRPSMRLPWPTGCGSWLRTRSCARASAPPPFRWPRGSPSSLRRGLRNICVGCAGDAGPTSPAAMTARVLGDLLVRTGASGRGIPVRVALVTSRLPPGRGRGGTLCPQARHRAGSARLRGRRDHPVPARRFARSRDDPEPGAGVRVLIDDWNHTRQFRGRPQPVEVPPCQSEDLRRGPRP